MHPEEAQRQRDILRSNLLLDEVQHLQRDGLSGVELGSGRRAEPQLNLSGIHSGEDFSAQAPPQKHHDRGRE